MVVCERLGDRREVQRPDSDYPRHVRIYEPWRSR